MPTLPLLRPVEAVRAFERHGWRIARRRGSHIILTKTGNPATLSVPDHRTVARGTLRTLIARYAILQRFPRTRKIVAAGKYCEPQVIQHLGMRGTVCHTCYHTSVVKTTVYLPESLKRDLGRTARAEGVSEAELIRMAVEKLVGSRSVRRPKLPLFSSGQPSLAEQVDEALAGFGNDGV